MSKMRIWSDFDASKARITTGQSQPKNIYNITSILTALKQKSNNVQNQIVLNIRISHIRFNHNKNKAQQKAYKSYQHNTAIATDIHDATYATLQQNIYNIVVTSCIHGIQLKGNKTFEPKLLTAAELLVSEHYGNKSCCCCSPELSKRFAGVWFGDADQSWSRKRFYMVCVVWPPNVLLYGLRDAWRRKKVVSHEQ